MSVKTGLPCALLVSMLVAGAGRCQDPYRAGAAPSAPPVAADGMVAPIPAALPPLVSDPYILRECPGCCGPRGKNGPITYELYLRTGLSLPVGGSGLPRTVETGWLIQGGGRSLFFNPAQTSAWTVDISISNIYNHGNQPERTYDFNGVPVSTQAVNRTFAGIAFGKEWYLKGPANNCNWNWRFGLDGGGQLGAMRLDLRDPAELSNYRRKQDVISGMFTALHTDVEIPFKSCVLLAGFRAEWAYTWSDVIQSIDSDFSNVNLMYTGGIRY